jgi:transcriptional regulator with XRE-family HTH domain
MEIHRELKQRRLNLGMTLEDVAKGLLVKPSTVSRWENGRKPAERDLRAWVHFLEDREAGVS